MGDFDAFARYRPLIDNWQAFLAALRRPLPVCVWANPLRTTPQRLAERLRAGGVTAEPLTWLPDAFRLPAASRPGLRLEYLSGLLYVQEEVSLLPPLLLAPRPGERVLDLCAAPGGKTARIAAALGGNGTVVANDRNLGRLNTVRANLDRLGAVNVTTTHYDGANYPPGAGPFDRVLADVPCTCEGTSRKSPEVLQQAGAESSRRMSGVQRALLAKALRLCRPGGRVVYSTCTYAPEENEEVISDVLARQEPGAVRLLPVRVPGLPAAPGITRWQGRELHPDLGRALRIWPHLHDTGGFFVAVMEKAADAELAAVAEPAPLPGPAEPESWRPYLEERFGLGPQAFAGLHVFRRGRRRLAVVAADHRPPCQPSPYTVGLPLLHTGREIPKLTTAAVAAFGRRATRNVVAADPEQALAYLRRLPFHLSPRQEAGLTAPGHVIVRRGEVVLGLGLLRHGGEVESLFPKRWAGVVRDAAPPGLEVGDGSV